MMDTNKIKGHEFVRRPPNYTWRWCFNGDHNFMVYVVKPPCLFYRLMQRLILNIHWEKIDER